jgi:phenylacetate-CoA ligase
MNKRLDRFSGMRSVYADAERKAPALARRLAHAGVRPQDLKDEESLSRLPVLKKERLLELQAAEPPFGGFLACEIAELGHIYVSPGPIFEPSPASDEGGHGMDMMFRSAGVGPGDLALNTWSYHLVPAGLLFDKGLRAVGATVIPAGTGNTELQAELLATLRPTVFLGSTAYFVSLVEQLRKSGRTLPDDWALRHAFLGGEFGDWSAKRRAIESDLRLKTWSVYGTADFGLIGYEIEGRSGYRIHNDRYVQICDPATGMPLATGEAGEIVVTTLTPGWPMIRFGTGDLGRAISLAPDGGVDWLGSIEGRIGAARKIREIFVYPDHLNALAGQIDGLAEARLCVSRENHRATITLELLPSGTKTIPLDAVANCFRTLTRLRADRFITVPSADAFTHTEPIAEDADVRND